MTNISKHCMPMLYQLLILVRVKKLSKSCEYASTCCLLAMLHKFCQYVKRMHQLLTGASGYTVKNNTLSSTVYIQATDRFNVDNLVAVITALNIPHYRVQLAHIQSAVFNCISACITGLFILLYCTCIGLHIELYLAIQLFSCSATSMLQ